LSDTLAAIYNEIYEFVIDNDEIVDLSKLGPLLDDLGEAITEVEVVGTYEHETEDDVAIEQKRLLGIQASANVRSAGIAVEASAEHRQTAALKTRVTRSGTRQHRVHFGRVGNTLQRLIEALPHKRIWLILDEWSIVPVDLQPFLADLIRRSIFPVRGYTVKIGAVEQRTNLYLPGERGDYIGPVPMLPLI
jgi:hypothetical protein